MLVLACSFSINLKVQLSSMDFSHIGCVGGAIKYPGNTKVNKIYLPVTVNVCTKFLGNSSSSY